MPRTNISVDHAVFEEFSYQAKRRDKSLFAFTNESLSAVSKICADGGDPTEIYRLWRSIALMKQLDVITLPSDFVDELIASQYATNKEKLLRMFRDLGARLAGVLKIAAGDLGSLAQLASDFDGLLPLKQFRITPSEGADVVEIGIVGAGRRMESTECSFEFLQAILNGYGFAVTTRDINVGTIRLTAERRKRPLTGKGS